MKDLFGREIPEPPPKPAKRDETPRGYAATPGTGPIGKQCRDCKHFRVLEYSKRYFKCYLIRHCWTSGFKTDIRAKSPACERYEEPEPFKED